MNFGDAILALKYGERVCRSGWNGKGMWLALIGGGQSVFLPAVRPTDELVCDAYVEASPHAPYIAMKTVDNKLVPWLASLTDVLAEDWEIV